MKRCGFMEFEKDRKYDVYGVGNAIVDILAFTDDAFIQKLDLSKGSMNLVDADRQRLILDGLEDIELKMKSGGSGANSMVGIAQSGGTGIFVGKVADDIHGDFYVEDMRETGIVFDIPPAVDSHSPTATSVILTTSDAERTMCTHLGASIDLSKTDIEETAIRESKVVYVEGYLWMGPGTKEACVRALEIAKQVGTKVSFTFSDSFVVEGLADEFKALVSDYCDIVFCNADEARAFSGETDLDAAGLSIGESVELVFITDGSAGCLVIEEGKIERVEGFKVDALDTVGAGDAFAGGALFGLTHGYSSQQAARWGNYLASEVVKIHGPRLSGDLRPQLEKILS